MKRVAVGLLALASLAAGGILLFRRPPQAPAAPAVPSVPGFKPEEVERILEHSPLGPPPPDPTNAVADSPEAAELGHRLFFDRRFSAGGKVACATCHRPERGFGDGLALPTAFSVDRNVPTLWNVAYNRWFFWDGRSDSLWSQALKPLENPREHGGTRLQFAHLVYGDPELSRRYAAVFGPLPDLSDPGRFPASGGPPRTAAGGAQGHAWLSMAPADRTAIDRIFANLGKALAAYERQLQSRHSPFDRFVEGIRTGDAAKLGALSPRAQEGLKIFIGRGNCRLCHSGPRFTDGEFHNIGIPPSRGTLTADRYAAVEEVKRDPFNSKGAYSDDPEAGSRKLDHLWLHQDLWGQIKTPALRNVARTGPYMHQGQFRTLRDVAHFYSTLDGIVLAGHHERTILFPLMLNNEQITSLVAFLESLTDESVDPRWLAPPQDAGR